MQIKSSGQIDPPGMCGDFPVFYWFGKGSGGGDNVFSVTRSIL